MRKAIFSLISGNLASKALGLVREIIVAALFGTGYINGAYRVAQTGTLVPVNFLVSDSLTAFIPLYKVFLKEDKDKAQLFFWAMQLLFLIFSIFLTLSAILFVEQWINLIAPGLNIETKLLAKQMLIVMSLGIPVYLSSALINYVEMAHGDFLPMSMRPSIQNIGMLLGALFAYITSNAMFLAWGFTFSYVIFFVWLIKRGIERKILHLPKSFDVAILKNVVNNFWKTLKPLILLPIIFQGNIAVERAVATLISLTAVSALDYAKFITETLLLVVSTPIALAGLASWGGVSEENIKIRLVQVFNLLMIFSLPVSIFLAINADLIVSTLFARGKFDQLSINVTSNILFGMSLGLWANVIGYVLIKALNSQLKNKYVMFIMTVSLLINILFNLLFYKTFQEMTLGLSYSLYGIIMLLGCLYFLKLWKGIIETIVFMSIGGVLYYLLSRYQIHLPNNILNLITNVLIFMIFWGVFLLIIPELRRKIHRVISREN